MNTRISNRIVVGVSSCLLGEQVRYDGRHKRDEWVCNELARLFDLLPVCPEVAIGLGVPRPPIRLVSFGRDTRAQRVDDGGRDVTDALAAYAVKTADRLGGSIDGFVFKLGSPSCGVLGVPRYTAEGDVVVDGSGIFARAFMERLPLLPVAEEDALHEAGSRTNFIERVQAHHRWRKLHEAGLSHRALIDFHGRYKLDLLARDEVAYRRLGRLVGEGSESEIYVTAPAYITLMSEVMKKVPARGGHVNALQHAAGFLREALSPSERAALQEVIEAYRQDCVDLAVPLQAIRDHLARHPQDFLGRQHYLATQTAPYGAK